MARIAGVTVWRNNSGKLADANGRWVTYGLGLGSADLVGLVRIELITYASSPGNVAGFPMGRFFALEIKVHGREKAHDTSEQDRWRDHVRKLGGFYRVIGSAEEAIEAVNACRRGES